jgi:hypothetical protein
MSTTSTARYVITGCAPGTAHWHHYQNIRNNQTKARTPKWAARYGLVDTRKLEAHQKRSQWSSRYNERNPNSTLEGQQYEEGQAAASGIDDLGADRRAPRPGEGENDLWNPSEESFYTDERASALEGGSGGRWHYPANFDDALPPDEPRRKKKGGSSGGSSSAPSKKDRWARTEDAYNAPAGSERRSKRKPRTVRTSSSTTDIPEDAEGGLFGSSRPSGMASTPDFDSGSRTPPARRPTGGVRDEFAHEFWVWLGLQLRACCI